MIFERWFLNHHCQSVGYISCFELVMEHINNTPDYHRSCWTRMFYWTIMLRNIFFTFLCSLLFFCTSYRAILCISFSVWRFGFFKFLQYFITDFFSIFIAKPFLWILFCPSWLNRCYQINNHHGFLNKVRISGISIFKI